MVALLVTMFLTACEKETSSVVIVPSCPPLAGYTKDERDEVDDKMRQTPDETWTKMIDDYYILRKNIREMCEKV